MTNATAAHPRKFSPFLDVMHSVSPNRTFLDIFLTTLPFVSLAFCTVALNAAVLYAVTAERSLRTKKNIYVASLTSANLVIGLCMFVAAVQQARGDQVSVLSLAWCSMYLIVKQGALYVSLLSLLLMSSDRWRSVYFPMRHIIRRSKKRALFLVVITWFFGFAISITWVSSGLLVKDPEIYSNTSRVSKSEHFCNQGKCELPFSFNVIFVSSFSGIFYGIPILIMLILNCSLYLRILGRRDVELRRSISVSSSHRVDVVDKPLSFCPTPEETEIVSYIETSNLLKKPRTAEVLSLSAPHKLYNFNRRSSTEVTTFSRTNCTHSIVSSRRLSVLNRLESSGIFHRRISASRASKDSEQLANELIAKQGRRTACCLLLFVVVILMCWLPDIVVRIISSASPTYVPVWAKDLSRWFLMANSLISPVLYGLCDKLIRRSLRNLILGRQIRRRSQTVRVALAEFKAYHKIGVPIAKSIDNMSEYAA